MMSINLVLLRPGIHVGPSSRVALDSNAKSLKVSLIP